MRQQLRIATLLAMVSAALPTLAANEHPIRSLSIDSGYLTNSSRAFWKFGQDVDGAVSTGFDGLSSTFLGNFFLTRLLLGGAFYMGWNHLEYGFFVANHELGHGSHDAAIGATPTYQWQNGSPQKSIFAFWATGFSQYNNGAQTFASFSSSPTNYVPLITASGMNNSNEYAEFIENQIAYGGGGHILQYIGYARGKTDASQYYNNTNGGQSGDPAEVVSFYESQGYNISAKDMKTGSLVARYLSATHWAFLRGAIGYIFSGNPLVRGPFLGALKLPDVSHYSTAHGVSYKIRSGLRSNSGFIPVALEYVYKGDSMIEGSLGYRASAANATSGYGFELSASSKGGLGVSGDYAFGLSSNLGFNIGASLYTNNSLNGNRRIAKYQGNGGYEAWARANWNY